MRYGRYTYDPRISGPLTSWQWSRWLSMWGAIGREVGARPL